MGKEEEQAVVDVIRSGWLTTGKIAGEFERDFRGLLNVPQALAVNSATAGLHLTLKGLEIPEESLVLTTPYTFAATGEVIRFVQAHPLFVDTEKDSFNIDPSLLEKTISENKNRISAVLPVHIAGHVKGMREITALGKDNKLPVIEDAAHAFPVATSRGFAGTLGDAGVFSFYATKPITTGEGGMVVTRNIRLAEKIRILRLHGIDRVVWDRYRSKEPANWEYDVVDAGYKYNMTDMAAAIGRVQFRKADLLYKKRVAIAQTYIKAFQELDYLKLPPGWEAPEHNHAWHLFILRVNEQKLTISRDDFIEKLSERGVGISVHFKPLHLMSYYRQNYGLKPEHFPNALRHFQTCFSLPIYPDLSEEQISRIINHVCDIGSSYYRL